MMKAFAFALTLALLVPLAAIAGNCDHVRQQSRDLRVKAIDDHYRMDLRLNDRWTQLLSLREQIIMPRLAIERAEVAFLLRADGVWTLQLMDLTGSSLQLGILSKKPAQICFDESEQYLHLVSENDMLTPLSLPALP